MGGDKKTATIEVSWSGGEQFQGKSASGITIPFDGNKKNGISPMEALLASLGDCMGIDVLMILEKMRMKPDSLRVIASGNRNEEPPLILPTHPPAVPGEDLRTGRAR